MRANLTLRTVILAPWAGALVLTGAAPQTGPLLLAVGLVWAAPMLRDRRRRSTVRG